MSFKKVLKFAPGLKLVAEQKSLRNPGLYDPTSILKILSLAMAINLNLKYFAL